MTPKEVGFYPRVAIGEFTGLGNEKLVPYVRNVVTMMTEDTVDYPEPVPTLAVVTTSVDSFDKMVQNAMSGDKVAMAIRNQGRSDLLSLVKQLAAYVTGHCNEDVPTLLKSGFNAIKAPSPSAPLDAPENLTLDYTGKTGEIAAKWSRVTNGMSYSVETADSADGPWSHEIVCTQSRATLTEFDAGKVTWVRVCANGSKGPSPYTSAVSIMVA